MNTKWPFDDPPNAASLTTSLVLNGSPILRVYHDFDGGWQFHGSPDDPVTEDVARIVSLESMVSRDKTIAELYDLPYGWRAERESTNAPWIREKNNPCATYAEDGYYLEDAVWMAEVRDDLEPPPQDIREDIAIGTYVKLLFRFASENEERLDGQTERMWVLTTDFDDQDYYIGTLENEPNHDGRLACGDTIHFHPLHVAEILEEEEE